MKYMFPTEWIEHTWLMVVVPLSSEMKCLPGLTWLSAWLDGVFSGVFRVFRWSNQSVQSIQVEHS